MLDHFGPIIVLGLAGALLGWATVVLASRIERLRRKRHADVFGSMPTKPNPRRFRPRRLTSRQSQ